MTVLFSNVYLGKSENKKIGQCLCRKCIHMQNQEVLLFQFATSASKGRMVLLWSGVRSVCICCLDVSLSSGLCLFL